MIIVLDKMRYDEDHLPSDSLKKRKKKEKRTWEMTKKEEILEEEMKKLRIIANENMKKK